jgi:hypothetical protein
MKMLFKRLYERAADFKKEVFKAVKRLQGRDDDFDNPYLIF